MAVLLFCVGIVAFGLMSYYALPRESFPEVDLPYIVIMTTDPGSNPTDVETSITIPIEEELEGIEGMKKVISLSAESSSMMSVEFYPEVDIDVALRRVKDAVDRARADLPDDVDEPLVKEFSTSSFPVLTYQIVGSENTARSEIYELAEIIQDRIKLVRGVLDVDKQGVRDREILIQVDPERLSFYNITLDRVTSILMFSNRNVSAGSADSETTRIMMRVPGEFKNVGDIFNLVIGFTQQSGPIYLKDVADVYYSFEDERSRARFYDFRAADGQKSLGKYTPPRKSVGLVVRKKSGANLLKVKERIQQEINRYPLPKGIEIITSMDQSKDIKMMVSDLENGIGTSLLLVLIVILIGLGLRNAILVSLAIPFSMLLSIIIIHMMGLTLNIIVLFALILALGMLVDNAIVIVENIYRHYSMGTSRVKSAMLGTAEVAWPVICSTATTVGAFLPLAFWPGMMGKFMRYLPMTVIVVLLSSLFVALVINPTLAALLMKKGDGNTDTESERPDYWLVCRYKGFLEFMLLRPVWSLTTGVAFLVLVITAYQVFGSGVEFFPTLDPPFVVCSIKPPDGMSLDASDKICRRLEARLFAKDGSEYERPIPNLKYAEVIVGLEEGMGSGFGDQNQGAIRINLSFVDREYRTEPTSKTVTGIRRRIRGLDFSGKKQVAPPLYGAEFDVFTPQEGPKTGKPVSVDIFGTDLNRMTRVINDMKKLIRSTPGTAKPTDDAVTAQPTLEWTVDKARAGMFGLDQGLVSNVMKLAVGGIIAGTYGHGDDEQDIRLRLPEDYRLSTGKLQNVTVPAPSGSAVPLVTLMQARLIAGPVAVKHLNGKRKLNASAEVQQGIRQDSDIRKKFQEKVKKYKFPAGIEYEFGGAAEEEQKAQTFLSTAFLIAIFIITMILVVQFNSISASVIVMFSVVLSLIGVFFGLLVLRLPFGIIMTGIAIISLAGVVVNNAIVLIDAIRRFEERESSVQEAIITASMIRFRPVLLTAITTILGLLPMALKLTIDFSGLTILYDTESAQWWQSMAISVIFGLLVATVLTLGVVPTFYLLFYRARKYMEKRAGVTFDLKE